MHFLVICSFKEVLQCVYPNVATFFFPRISLRMIPTNNVRRLIRRHQVNGAQRDLDVRLTTFNLLAPCYKRMHAEVMPAGTEIAVSGLLASEAKSRRTSRESEFTELWKERALQTVSYQWRLRPEMSIFFFSLKRFHTRTCV